MSGLQQYLLSVAAAALLTGVVLSLMPQGRVYHAARFLGALILVLTAVSPIVKIDTDRIAKSISEIQISGEDLQADAQAKNREMLSMLIKQQCESYILDKAEQLGIAVSVEIVMREEGDYPYPDTVKISGAIGSEDRSYLERIIEQDLGIPVQRQEWRESG